MLFFKNRLVFGIIKKVISSIFKALYAIIKIFNLQLFLLILVVGGIVYLTGGFSSSEVLKWAFYLLCGLSLVYAVVETFRKLFGLDKKKKKENDKKEEEPKDEKVKGRKEKIKKVEESDKIDEEVVQEKVQREEKEQQPKYFRVKDSKDLIMAEYDDRVELYRVENGQMVKIRTDYKNGDKK